MYPWKHYHLTIINLLISLGILAWPILFYMSVFLFDAPGSSSNPITVGLYWSLLWYPVPAVIGITLFFKNRDKGRVKEEIKYTLLGSSGYIAIVVCIILLEVLCDGQTGCK